MIHIDVVHKGGDQIGETPRGAEGRNSSVAERGAAEADVVRSVGPDRNRLVHTGHKPVFAPARGS